MSSANGMAEPASLVLDQDKLTLVADDLSFSDFFRQLSHLGVTIKADPSLAGTITSVVVDEPLDKAFERLLRPYGYAAIWEVVRGPLGDMPRLAELQVFREGQRERIRPVVENTRFDITRGPTGRGPAYVQDEILITVKRGVSKEEFKRWLAQIGGTLAGSVPGVGVYRIRLPPGTNIEALIAQLENSPLIHAVEPNYAAELPPGNGLATGELPPGAIAPKIPKGAAAVAVLDSGLSSAYSLGTAVAGSYDAVVPGRTLDDPKGHGTQMAMVASGAVKPKGTENDVTAGTPVLAIRAFDEEGRTSNYALMRSIEYAVEGGARVINISWGSDTESEFVADSIAYAQSKGLVVVAAAGNEPTGQQVYPASLPGVVSVAALNSQGELWNQSNYGDTVSFAAPGAAEFPIGHEGPPGSYVGTSIASVYVAKQFAEYFTANPNATAKQAKEALVKMARDEGTKGRDPRYGYGVLD